VLPGLAVGLLADAILVAHRRRELGLDFRNVSPQMRGLVHGVDPYVIANVGEGGHFLWTVLAGWLLLPFAWLPGGYLLIVLLEAVGIAASALLLGVRDWRLVAIALAWPATINSVESGNITVLVTVLLAATWYERGRTRAGLWAGLAVGVKLFAWPVLVWLAATRRWRALAIALAVQLFSLLIMLPYTSLSDYVHFESTVDRIMSGQAITLDALTRDLGGSPHEGQAVALAVGLAILWKGRKDLGWVTVAMLVLSPIVWLHYFGLLIVPLALWSSSLLVWSIPLLFFVAPGQGNGGPWHTAAALGVFALTTGVAWARRDRGRSGSVGEHGRQSAPGLNNGRGPLARPSHTVR
jgi:hypothetical protein